MQQPEFDVLILDHLPGIIIFLEGLIILALLYFLWRRRKNKSDNHHDSK